jgi:hypothetical protein
LTRDTRVVHRVADAKIAAARFKISTSSRSLRFSRRNSVSCCLSALVSSPSLLVCASRPGWPGVERLRQHDGLAAEPDADLTVCGLDVAEGEAADRCGSLGVEEDE